MSQHAAEKIFCALDTTDIEVAVNLAKSLKGVIGGIKLGLEFFCSTGPEGVKAVSGVGMPLFLDLKFHDIPNTVAGAIKAIMPLSPKIITIHTQGGAEMMRRASATVIEESERLNVTKPLICGVTVLTSLDQDDLSDIGVTSPVNTQVSRLASLAHKSGLDGMVCSPNEISLARNATHKDFTLVVPGIRPVGASTDDQKRVMTPLDAVQAGADILVIGRPITKAKDPAKAARSIVQSLG